MSARTAWATPGYCTLTATSRPSCRRRGRPGRSRPRRSASRRRRRRSRPAASPSSDSITLRMSLKRTFGAASRSSPSLRWNSSRYSSGTRPTSRNRGPGPIFIAAPFIVPSAATICSAASRWRRSSASCAPVLAARRGWRRACRAGGPPGRRRGRRRARCARSGRSGCGPWPSGARGSGRRRRRGRRGGGGRGCLCRARRGRGGRRRRRRRLRRAWGSAWPTASPSASGSPSAWRSCSASRSASASVSAADVRVAPAEQRRALLPGGHGVAEDGELERRDHRGGGHEGDQARDDGQPPLVPGDAAPGLARRGGGGAGALSLAELLGGRRRERVERLVPAARRAAAPVRACAVRRPRAVTAVSCPPGA